MGLELAEQFEWKLPEVIVFSTGGGSGIIGLWKAFSELRELGWVQGQMPRIFSVQELGCDPLAKAARKGLDNITPLEPTMASPTGLRVPHPPDAKLLLHILHESGGTAVSVSKQEISRAQYELGSYGISASPEGAATWACLETLVADGLIKNHERVVLFNTSHSLKYRPCENRLSLPVIDSYDDWHLTRYLSRESPNQVDAHI